MNSKKLILSENQRLEKKSILLKMEKEIKKLEFELNHSDIANTKIHLLRALKTSLRFGQLIAPYVATAGIAYGCFTALGMTPFFINDSKKKLETQKSVDSFGNIKYEQQYDEYKDTRGKIFNFGKWEKQPDGFYSRQIKTYLTGKIDEELIMKIINNNDIESLDDVFGNPISLKTEKRNNLTDEKLKNTQYLEAVIYSKSDNDFIVVKEAVSENILSTMSWALSSIMLNLLIFMYRLDHPFNFKNRIDEIKEKYPLMDITLVKQVLEIKRSNYNRLMR